MPPPAWQSATVSTEGVQNAFLRARLAEINRSDNHRQLLEQTLAALRQLLPSLQQASRDQQLETFIRITDRLQQAPLTINFKAGSWFMRENPYDSYAQMYERATKGGKMLLDNSDPNNPARIRVAADDLVTFPSSWMRTTVSNPATGATTRTVNAPAMTRGLSPDFARRAVLSKMSPGDLRAVHADKPDSLTEKGQQYEAGNLQFSPKTKQLFTAVNYGRRFHGSTTRYGHSYFRLHDRFKRRALYFAGDTFLALYGASNSGNDQVTYDLIGALVCKAKPALQRDLISSCLHGAMLGDTCEEELLVEAHLFEPLQFSNGVMEMCISAKDRELTYWENNQEKHRPLTDADIQTIGINARKFAQKHGCRIVFLD